MLAIRPGCLFTYLLMVTGRPSWRVLSPTHSPLLFMTRRYTGPTGRPDPSTPATNTPERNGEKFSMAFTRRWTSRCLAKSGSPTVSLNITKIHNTSWFFFFVKPIQIFIPGPIGYVLALRFRLIWSSIAHQIFKNHVCEGTEIFSIALRSGSLKRSFTFHV